MNITFQRELAAFFRHGGARGLVKSRTPVGEPTLIFIGRRFALGQQASTTWLEGRLIVQVKSLIGTCPVSAAGSSGRCNTICYKAAFKGGVYDRRETVWAFGGAKERRVASLEGGRLVA
jgi:hypothetical protein